MKKQLITMALVAITASTISAKKAASELSSSELAQEVGKRVVRGIRTKVDNKTDRDIWVTWKASSIFGKAAQSVSKAGGLVKHTYTMLQPNESYSMEHLYDGLTVRYYVCENGKVVRKEIDTERKRGGRMVVSSDSSGKVTIKEETE